VIFYKVSSCYEYIFIQHANILFHTYLLSSYPIEISHRITSNIADLWTYYFSSHNFFQTDINQSVSIITNQRLAYPQETL